MVLIYPLKKYVGDLVYAVSFYRNISGKQIPHLVDRWHGDLWGNFYSESIGNEHLTFPHGRAELYPSPLDPGKVRLNWIQGLREKESYLHDGSSKGMEGGFSVPLRTSWLSEDLRVKIPEGRSSDYYCAPVNYYQRKEEQGGTIHDLRELSEEEKELEKFDWLIGEATPRGMEHDGSPSTIQEEMELTRRIRAFLAAEEFEAVGKMKEIVEFVDSRPFPQKFVMSFRLHRLDSKTGISEQQREVLPEKYLHRLELLNREFQKLRESALKTFELPEGAVLVSDTATAAGNGAWERNSSERVLKMNGSETGSRPEAGTNVKRAERSENGELPTGAWTVNVSSVGKSVLETASLDGKLESGGRTWDPETAYPKFVLSRTLHPDAERTDCKVVLKAAMSIGNAIVSGGSFTLHRLSEDGEYEEPLELEEPFFWSADEKDEVEFYLNPKMGSLEKNLTVTLSVLPQEAEEEEVETKSGDSYVPGLFSSAELLVVNDRAPYLMETGERVVNELKGAVFLAAGASSTEVPISLPRYFRDEEDRDDLTYSFTADCGGILDMEKGKTRITGRVLYLSPLKEASVGEGSVTVTARDTVGQETNWTIRVFSDRLIGYFLQEYIPERDGWRNVPLAEDGKTLVLQTGTRYRILPKLAGGTLEHAAQIDCFAQTWEKRGSFFKPIRIGTTEWNRNRRESQTVYVSNCGVEWIPKETGEFALKLRVILDAEENRSQSSPCFLNQTWGTSAEPADAFVEMPRIVVQENASETMEPKISESKE